MSATAASREDFSLGTESGRDGSFKRQDSGFRGWVSSDGSTEFPLEAGRYHLYVSMACPWAHRTLIARLLMGLEDAIQISVVDPVRDKRGWRFSGGKYVDSLGRFKLLMEAYEASDPGYSDRASVPVLWDTKSQTIDSNESADLIRMLSTTFAPLAEHPVVLYPPELAAEIDELNDRLYDNVNNAVYKAGFTTSQEVYEREVRELFEMLDELDERLASSRYLFGDFPLESDWRLFTTLVRFDAVYNIHFKCSVRKIAEYANLWPYLRDLYQHPGIAETVSFDEIRSHYYLTHPMINPSGLVALQPDEDFDEPHGREALGGE